MPSRPLVERRSWLYSDTSTLFRTSDISVQSLDTFIRLLEPGVVVSHPFGDIVSQHLHRKHGFSQSRLAAGIMQEPTIVTRMCKGQRLTGPQARERVVAIIKWLHQQGVLETHEEANALLNAAGMSALHARHPVEIGLMATLAAQVGNATYPAAGLDAHTVTIPNEFPAPHVLSDAAQSWFVGRKTEWESLQAIWSGCAQGHAHVVLIEGEAGIGKTRLAEEFVGWAAGHGVVTAHSRSYAAEGRLAYAPLIEWLRTPALRVGRKRLDPASLTELARLLPELLQEFPGISAPNPNIENSQRHRLIEALTIALLAIQQPMLLVLDDVQWCDQETLEWLHFLLRRAPQSPVLIVCTARPEALGTRHPVSALRLGLRNNHQLTEIRLTTLTAQDTAELARRMMGNDLNPDRVNRLYRDTEGNPLFVVEMLRAEMTQTGEGKLGSGHGASTGQDGIPAMVLPPGVQVVIDSRLAQLTPRAHKLAELAATIGRGFSYQVLAHISNSNEDDVIDGLDELCLQHIVRERGADDFDFSHDKIREVMYARVGATRRRLLHHRIAQFLERTHASALDTVSGQLAVHYEKAGFAETSIPYYLRAAQAALRNYANHEAIGHFNQGLTALANQPASEDRSRRELQFLLGLGLVTVAAHGFGASRVYEIFSRAQILIHELGEPPNPSIYRALAIYFLVRRSVTEAYAQGEKIMAVAHQAGDGIKPVFIVEGHYVLGASSHWQGEFARARDHFECALDAYDERLRDIHITSYSQDPIVVCLIRLANTLWFLGYPEQARARCEEGLRLARTLAHPFSLGYAICYASVLGHDLRDQAMMQALVTEGITQALSRVHDEHYWMITSVLIQGFLIVEHGEYATGLTQTRATMRDMENLQLDIFFPYSSAVLAQAQAKTGLYEESLATVNNALTSIVHHGDRWYEAELYRVKGELLDKLETVPSIVESCLQHAYTIARVQQARSLELRAATSLGRFLAKHGRREQGQALLAETYSWFTEGFDTADLQEAKAVLASLT